MTACLAGAIGLAPGRADACDPANDACIGDVVLLSPGPLPEGAVLTFHPRIDGHGLLGGGEYGPDGEEWNPLTVTVRPAGGGEAIEGELTGLRPVVWRPKAALPADSAYLVTASWADVACGAEAERSWTVMTTAAALPPPTAPEVTAETKIRRVEGRALADLVCCDGAFPQETFSNGCHISVEWDEGTCVPARGTNWLEATLQLDPATTAAAGGQVVYEFVGVGSFDPKTGTATGLSVTPLCGAVHATSLATGETVAGPERCFGEEFAAELGEQELDVSQALAACVDPAYTCELADDGASAWDPNRCSPVESTAGEDDAGGGGSKGCSCDADASSPGAWGLAALLLPWLLRRRARRIA